MRAGLGAVALAVAVALAGCTTMARTPAQERADARSAQDRAEVEEYSRDVDDPAAEEPLLTLAFAGDVHFERGLAGLPVLPGTTVGPMSRVLQEADLSMVNLESALTSGGGSPTAKEKERASRRYWFRSPPEALDLLDRSGVDAVSVANNHGADYGAAGLRETVAIAQDSPVEVVGAGMDAAQAFAGSRLTVKGTEVALLAADASFRESDDAIWAAGEGGPGIAGGRADPPIKLLRATRTAAAEADLVVVYLHWGEENEACPTGDQRRLAEALAEAGADVVVGSHAHVLLGSGMLGDTYVNYGLGNFFWYHGQQADTGVLRLQVRGDEVVDEDWLPARIPRSGGQPVPATGAAGTEAVQRWTERRGCSGLPAAPQTATADAEDPGQASEDAPAAPEQALPAYAAQVRALDPALRRRMTGVSHDPARCPVSLDDLRRVTVRHVDFAGRPATGELVVAAEVATDVVQVFRELYEARWPIARMRLIEDYDGDDDASMAANNSSGYNCRTVAGSGNLSDHAYGRAIDLNPVQNPYVMASGIAPSSGRPFADADRSTGAPYRQGVVRDGDVVVRAFARVGWEWGDGFSDYQHFFVP